MQDERGYNTDVCFLLTGVVGVNDVSLLLSTVVLDGFPPARE